VGRLALRALPALGYVCCRAELLDLAIELKRRMM
jgi:hypothetical protein